MRTTLARTGYEGRHDKWAPGVEGGVLEWQPGNGLRYLFAVKALTLAEGSLVGVSEGGVLVSVWTHDVWYTMAIHEGGLVHISYVAEKWPKLSEGELYACTALINLAIGDEEYGIELYDYMMRRWVT